MKGVEVCDDHLKAVKEEMGSKGDIVSLSLSLILVHRLMHARLVFTVLVSLSSRGSPHGGIKSNTRFTQFAKRAECRLAINDVQSQSFSLNVSATVRLMAEVSTEVIKDGM